MRARVGEKVGKLIFITFRGRGQSIAIARMSHQILSLIEKLKIKILIIIF